MSQEKANDISNEIINKFHFCENYSTKEQANQCVDRLIIQYLDLLDNNRNELGTKKVAQAFRMTKLRIDDKFYDKHK
jgi:hypothetical protein